MEEYRVLDRYQCILFDGTEHYCSASSACEHCLTKVHRNKKGDITKTTYHHQALTAVMAHYDHKEVFPVACEPIVRQDGETKNDCELNASKRLLPVVRQMLPAYELLGVFDGLHPNGLMIRLLASLQMRYVIGIQEGYVLIQGRWIEGPKCPSNPTMGSTKGTLRYCQMAQFIDPKRATSGYPNQLF
ncbi:hypothetical protein [Flavilitoribacter nigricans]|uniref:hypothetical protein n=1 Tax=Flavilitoribacter nigricans TaxID=70997 RepID=UPI00117B3CB8|nr:hypothetical protein [Flavilitoribacter nigricans]